MKEKTIKEIHKLTRGEISFLTNKIISRDQLSKLNPYIIDKIHFKSYPRFESVRLPHRYGKSKSLYEVINSRRSFRDFSGKKITINEISEILRFSCGINYIINSDWDKSLRVYPSAGARYPLEIYPLIINVKGLRNGIHHYNVKNHSLEFLWEVDSKTLKNVFGEDWIIKASCIFLITAIFDRTTIKYGYRGYRYILLEAGHVAQNILLVSTSLNIHSCCIGGFWDDKLDELLDIKNTPESIIYCVAVGR
jgi:SagB-type dehydrogenase family enzyme